MIRQVVLIGRQVDQWKEKLDQEKVYAIGGQRPLDGVIEIKEGIELPELDPYADPRGVRRDIFEPLFPLGIHQWNHVWAGILGPGLDYTSADVAKKLINARYLEAYELVLDDQGELVQGAGEAILLRCIPN